MATEVEKQSSQESLEYDEKEAESEIMDALPFMETDLKKEETPAPSTITSPEISPSFPPLPDFMSVLNMQPAKKDDESGTTTVTTTITPGNNTQTQDSIVAVTTKVEEVEEKAGGVSLTPGTKEMLVDKFKQDPSGVLGLLQSALSVDKLSRLLKEEYKNDTELLSQLQNRLEAAYHTLKECQVNKANLSEKITETNQKIGEKRKHLETVRGELKILGDQELKLKRRRDLYQTKFADLTKKMKCSTEALQQIAHITKATGPSSHGNSTNGHDKSTNKVANGKHQEATVV